MIDILTTDNDNLIPIFMLALCLITLNLRGFFRKRKFLKLSLLFVSYFIALFTEIRFGFNTFFQSLLLHLAAFFISSICAILINKRHAEMQNSIVPKILDLTEYDQLSDQDRTIIKLLKEGQKYDWIAGHLGIATSTLKKRVKNIFEILGVVDLIDFHAQLGTLTFIYTKEELLGWKKRFLEENYGV